MGITASIACLGQAALAALPQKSKIEAAVEKKLSGMTLDEKIGQMTELSIDVLGEWKNGEFILDKEKLHLLQRLLYLYIQRLQY